MEAVFEDDIKTKNSEKDTFLEAEPIKKKERWAYNKWLLKNIPFYLFLSILAVFYIANGHKAETMERKLIKTEKHIKELNLTYKVVKREVVFRGKLSELVKVVAPLGLETSKEPPIIIKKDK